MMRFLKALLGLAIALAVLITGVLVAARFADGPWAMIAGGPFTSGEMHQGGEPDWSELKDTVTLEFQSLEPARSRTTWLAVHEGRVFIPSGYMTTTWGRIWKRWPVEAERDGRVILRVNDKLYDRTLVRVEQAPELEPVLAELGRKYAPDGAPLPLDAVTSGYLWIFELTPRG
jgi:hypothetical protein